METFSPAQEPDEGYSEHPLNTSASGSIRDTINSALALRSSAELPAWLAAQMPTLTVQEKKRKRDRPGMGPFLHGHLAMLLLM